MKQADVVALQPGRRYRRSRVIGRCRPASPPQPSDTVEQNRCCATSRSARWLMIKLQLGCFERGGQQTAGDVALVETIAALAPLCQDMQVVGGRVGRKGRHGDRRRLP